MSLDVSPLDAPVTPTRPSIVARIQRHRTAALVGLIFMAAVALRSVTSIQHTFEEGVWFAGNDPWFHMRTIRNLLQHLPWRSGFDPYSAFPTGQPVTTGPFFDYVIALTAWTLGLGQPGPDLVDTVGAWFPPVLGALVCVVAFFTGRTLFSPLAGLGAAALVAVYPGFWFLQSRLGFVDHHVMEALLASSALLFLFRALRAERPWRDTLLAGLSLGCLLTTRPAAAFVVGILAVWVVVQGAVHHRRGTSNDRLAQVTGGAVLLAAALFLPVRELVWGHFALLMLSGGLASAFAPALLTRALDRAGAPRWTFLPVLAILAIACGLVGAALRPDAARALIAAITTRTLAPEQTVLELRPLLALDGAFSLDAAWRELTASWILALPVLAVLIIRIPRQDAALNLFTVWSVATLCLALAQYRMIVYLAPSVAVLAAAAGGWLMDTEDRRTRWSVALAFVVCAIAPNLWYLAPTLRERAALPDDWRRALLWLRDNSPEPMEGPEAYDAYYAGRPPGVPFVYPPSAYGVMNWWEHGHWITAVARRIPVSNGMQTGTVPPARFFLSRDPEEAAGVLDEIGARYVIADGRLLVPETEDLRRGRGGMLGMLPVLGQERADYCEVLFETAADGSRRPFFVFTPAYFRTALVRLWLYDGRPVSAQAPTWAFWHRAGPSIRGVPTRDVTRSLRFESYEEAEAYRRQHPDEPIVIGGREPFDTIVPLEAFTGLRPVYTWQASGVPGLVKIFVREGK